MIRFEVEVSKRRRLKLWRGATDTGMRLEWAEGNVANDPLELTAELAFELGKALMREALVVEAQNALRAGVGSTSKHLN